MSHTEHNDRNRMDEWMRNAAMLPDGAIDQPSPAIWEHIRKAREQQRKRRRRLAGWWAAAVGLVGIGLLTGLYFHFTGQHPSKTDSPATPKNFIAKSYANTRANEPEKPIDFISDHQGAAEQTLHLPSAQTVPTSRPEMTDFPVNPRADHITAHPDQLPHQVPNQPALMLGLKTLPILQPAALHFSSPLPGMRSALPVKKASAQPMVYGASQVSVLFSPNSTTGRLAGLTAGYQINRQWSIESGLQLLQVSRTSQYYGRMRYRSGLARVVNAQQPLVESTGMEDISTGMGDLTLRYTLSRDPDQVLADQEWVPVRLRIQENCAYWRIPLLVRYQATQKRRYWAVAGGGGMNFRFTSSGKVQRAESSNDQVRSIRAHALGLHHTPAATLAHGELHLAAGYRLNRFWSAEIAPSLQIGPERLFLQNTGNALTTAFGVQFRLLYAPNLSSLSL